MKIVVLCGGVSPERDVSLSTGAKVASALRESGNMVALVDSAADITGDPEAMFKTGSVGEKAEIGDTAPDIADLLRRRNYFGSGVIDICRSADIVFNAMHGGAGEDGTLQAAFDLLGIKYTGSGSKGCSVSMDKAVTKRIMAPVKGVSMPKGITLNRFDFEGNEQSYADNVIKEVGLPMVIKPAGGGSSVGVSIVRSREEVLPAIELALAYERKAVAEEYIKGREFSVGVLGGRALPPIEIIPKTGFYDYKNKYQSGCTDEICPADITEKAAEEMKEAAVIVHEELGLSAYSRTDFIMAEDGRIFALEANTLPGMTPMSLLPQEAAVVGIDFPALCSIIIKESLSKYDTNFDR
ncbi:MAG: D-alanine--D-alanine ligase [Clostridiales bacterium]|nr:D-alanine--D-alanine ligase [Clostridiales bacterium]